MSIDKILSVIQKADSFFYVISDKNPKHLNSDDFNRFDISNLSWIKKFDQVEFDKILISILTCNFTLVPSSVDSSTISDHLISELMQKNDDISLHQELIYSQDAKLIYTLDDSSNWIDQLSNHSKNVHVNHYFTPILQNLTYNVGKDGVFAFIEKDLLGIVVMKNKRIQLVNSYSIQEVEQYLYFILLAFNQTYLSADSDKLFLVGQVLPESTLYRYIYKYVRNVEFLAYDNSTYSDAYRYYDMQSLINYG